MRRHGWDQFSALVSPHDDTHPLVCHRPRIPDRVVFGKLVQIFVFGCAYWRIADADCSATTLRGWREILVRADAYVSPAQTSAGRRAPS